MKRVNKVNAASVEKEMESVLEQQKKRKKIK